MAPLSCFAVLPTRMRCCRRMGTPHLVPLQLRALSLSRAIRLGPASAMPCPGAMLPTCEHPALVLLQLGALKVALAPRGIHVGSNLRGASLYACSRKGMDKCRQQPA